MNNDADQKVKKRKTRKDKGKKRSICDCNKYDYCRVHGSPP